MSKMNVGTFCTIIMKVKEVLCYLPVDCFWLTNEETTENGRNDYLRNEMCMGKNVKSEK